MGRRGRSILIILIIIANIAINIMIQQEMLETSVGIAVAAISVVLLLSLLPEEKAERGSKKPGAAELQADAGAAVETVNVKDTASEKILLSSHSIQVIPFSESNSAEFTKEDKDGEASLLHQQQWSDRDANQFFRSLIEENSGDKQEINEEEKLVFSPMDNIFGQEVEEKFTFDGPEHLDEIVEEADSADVSFAFLPLEDAENDEADAEIVSEEQAEEDKAESDSYEDATEIFAAFSPMDDIFGQQIEQEIFNQSRDSMAEVEECEQDDEFLIVSESGVGDFLRELLAELSPDSGLISNVSWRTLFGILGAVGLAAHNKLAYLVVDNHLTPTLAIAILDSIQAEEADFWQSTFSRVGLPLLLLRDGENCSERVIHSFVASNVRN